MSMAELSAVFFLKKSIRRVTLSDIISKCNGMILSKSALGTEYDIPFPIIKQEYDNGETYYQLTLNKNSSIQAAVNGEKTFSKILTHGDYLNIAQNNKLIFSVLILSHDKLKLSTHCIDMGNKAVVTIGRALDNEIIYDLTAAVARKHAVIQKTEQGVLIQSINNSLVYVNGLLINKRLLTIGDEIFIMGMEIIYMGNFLIISAHNCKCSLKTYKEFAARRKSSHTSLSPFMRSPRIYKSIESGEYKIDPPTAKKNAKELPLFLMMGSSGAMALIMVISTLASLPSALSDGQWGSVIMSSAIASIFVFSTLMMPVITRRYNKKSVLEEETNRVERYNQYINRCAVEIDKKYTATQRLLSQYIYPSADTLGCMLDSRESMRRLWERSQKDKDFLELRLGVGEKEFPVRIAIPEEGFVEDVDDLREYPRRLYDKYHMMQNVPITLPLMEYSRVGVIGSHKKIVNLANCLLLNIAAFHAPDQVKVAVIYNKDDSEQLDWVKEIQHIWSIDKCVRFIAQNENESYEVISSIARDFAERLEKLDGNEKRRDVSSFPYVIFVFDDKIVDQEALNEIFDLKGLNTYAVGVFVYDSYDKLPSDCEVIVQYDDSISTVYIQNENNNRPTNCKMDTVAKDVLKKFSQKMTLLPLKETYRNSVLPKSISFLEMYHQGNVKALNILARWRNCDVSGSMSVPIGVKSNGELMSLDIHESYDGSHGLVAGTNGSGKSEFLQTLILSLMVNFSPNEVEFMLIDFKEGNMARPFKKAPHIAAIVSNLSGAALNRALISIDTEKKRRADLIAQAAEQLQDDTLNNINSYQKAYKENKLIMPLPHLVIIVDEFAQLKLKEPEIFNKMIELSRTGRSYGIHLILATQKPDGIIDPQISGNIKFKVCLSVAEKSDSTSMIGRADAAYISNMPGRAYIQVAQHVPQLFQSSYSGAKYIPSLSYIQDEAISVHMIASTATPIRSIKDNQGSVAGGKSQIEEIISDICRLGEQEKIYVPKMWLDPLPSVIYESTIPVCKQNDKAFTLPVAVGLCDCINLHSQPPLILDLPSDGNTIIYGSASSGKTMMIQTYLYRLCTYYSPRVVNIVINAFGGNLLNSFSILPHCAALYHSEDSERIEESIDSLLYAIEERKQILEQNGCSSYAEYASIESSSKATIPAIVLVIDNFAPFREDPLDDCMDKLTRLASVGYTYGIYFIITCSSTNAIPSKLYESFRNIISLQLNDQSEYRSVLNAKVEFYPENYPGRGLINLNSIITEFQSAICGNENDTPEKRSMNIRKHFEKISSDYFVSNPSMPSHGNIGIMPDTITPEYFESLGMNISCRNIPVGLVPKSNKPLLYDFASDKVHFIIKENVFDNGFLLAMVDMMSHHGSEQVVVLDMNRLFQTSVDEGMETYFDSDEIEAYITQLWNLMKQRAFQGMECKNKGLPLPNFEHHYVIINDFTDLCETISNDAVKYLINLIIGLSNNYHIHFIILDSHDNCRSISSPERLARIIPASYGIVLGDDSQGQTLFGDHTFPSQIKLGFGSVIIGNTVICAKLATK